MSRIVGNPTASSDPALYIRWKKCDVRAYNDAPLHDLGRRVLAVRALHELASGRQRRPDYEGQRGRLQWALETVNLPWNHMHVSSSYIAIWRAVYKPVLYWKAGYLQYGFLQLFPLQSGFLECYLCLLRMSSVSIVHVWTYIVYVDGEKLRKILS